MNLQKGILQACTEQHMGLFLYDCSYRSKGLVCEIKDLVSNTLVDGLILAPPICDRIDLLEMLDQTGDTVYLRSFRPTTTTKFDIFE